MKARFRGARGEIPSHKVKTAKIADGSVTITRAMGWTAVLARA